MQSDQDGMDTSAFDQVLGSMDVMNGQGFAGVFEGQEANTGAAPIQPVPQVPHTAGGVAPGFGFDTSPGNDYLQSPCHAVTRSSSYDSSDFYYNSCDNATYGQRAPNASPPYGGTQHAQGYGGQLQGNHTHMLQHYPMCRMATHDSMDRSTLDNSMANSVLAGGIPTDIKPDLITLASAASQQQQPTGFSPSSTQPGYSPSNSNNSGSGYSPSSSTGQPQQNYFNMMPNSTTHMPAGAGGAPVGGIHSPTMHSPSSSTLSPTSTMGSGYGQAGMANKHNCSICGDRASGKHYGVHSCEGCKGFFKRTIRKDLTYACRDDRNCIIDKRQRNRCQYCRYMKCLSMGMKREAVQEERQRVKERGEGEVESTNCANTDMPVEKILEAEIIVEPKYESYVDTQVGDQNHAVTNICQAADKQLFSLVEWAKHIPHFTDLPIRDQVILLRAGWNELLIAAFSHRSTTVKEGILLATGLHVHRSSAQDAGVGTIFDRVLTELVAKMREIRMDKAELGSLRAIVLFNPDAKGLTAVAQVESLREKVYASLEEYCKTKYQEEPGRFAKLLLRLPALRSIGLKCLEHLFFYKLVGDTPLDTFLMEMLEAPGPTPVQIAAS